MFFFILFRGKEMSRVSLKSKIQDRQRKKSSEDRGMGVEQKNNVFSQ